MIFAIVAAVVMVVVMADRLRVAARTTPGRCTCSRSPCCSALAVYGSPSPGDACWPFDVGPIQIQPAEFAKFTVLLALCAYLSDERSDEVSYPRFLGGLMIVGAARPC